MKKFTNKIQCSRSHCSKYAVFPWDIGEISLIGTKISLGFNTVIGEQKYSYGTELQLRVREKIG